MVACLKKEENKTFLAHIFGKLMFSMRWPINLKQSCPALWVWPCREEVRTDWLQWNIIYFQLFFQAVMNTLDFSRNKTKQWQHINGVAGYTRCSTLASVKEVILLMKFCCHSPRNTWFIFVFRHFLSWLVIFFSSTAQTFWFLHLNHKYHTAHTNLYSDILKAK